MSVATKQKQYFLVVGEEQTGPYSTAEIQTLLKGGKISRTTHIWAEGMPEWSTLEKIPEFSKPLPPPLKVPPIPKASRKAAAASPQIHAPKQGASKYVGWAIIATVGIGMLIPVGFSLLVVLVPLYGFLKLNLTFGKRGGIMMCAAVIGALLLFRFGLSGYLSGNGQIILHKPTIEGMSLGYLGTVNSALPRLVGANGKAPEWTANGNDTFIYIKKPSGTSYLKFTFNPATNFVLLTEVNVNGQDCSTAELAEKLFCIQKIMDTP